MISFDGLTRAGIVTAFCDGGLGRSRRVDASFVQQASAENCGTTSGRKASWDETVVVCWANNVTDGTLWFSSVVRASGVETIVDGIVHAIVWIVHASSIWTCSNNARVVAWAVSVNTLPVQASVSCAAVSIVALNCRVRNNFAENASGVVGTGLLHASVGYNGGVTVLSNGAGEWLVIFNARIGNFTTRGCWAGLVDVGTNRLVVGVEGARRGEALSNAANGSPLASSVGETGGNDARIAAVTVGSVVATSRLVRIQEGCVTSSPVAGADLDVEENLATRGRIANLVGTVVGWANSSTDDVAFACDVVTFSCGASVAETQVSGIASSGLRVANGAQASSVGSGRARNIGVLASTAASNEFSAQVDETTINFKLVASEVGVVALSRSGT